MNELTLQVLIWTTDRFWGGVGRLKNYFSFLRIIAEFHWTYSTIGLLLRAHCTGVH